MAGVGDAICDWLQGRLQARGITDALVEVDEGREVPPRRSRPAAAEEAPAARTYRVDVLLPSLLDPLEIGHLIAALARDLEVEPQLGDRLETTSAGRLGPIKGAVPGRLIFEITVT